ncbi:hypothetical protein [Streptomyces antimycoticus]
MPHRRDGHGPYGTAAYFLSRGRLGGQERLISAVVGLAPLIEGAGDVDPVPGLALGGGQADDVDPAGVLNGLAGIAEQVADGDPMEENLARAEDGAVQGGIPAELVRSGFRFVDQGVGRVPVALLGGGVGGCGVQVALPT